jgi:hypothetical protein
MRRRLLVVLQFVAMAGGASACGHSSPGLSATQGGSVAASGPVSYTAFLGRNIDAPDIAAFRQRVGDCQTSGLHYICKGEGIELSTGNAGTILGMLLYAPGADGFSGYQGRLPDGLTWSDPRATVLAKLGTPDLVQAGTPGAAGKGIAAVRAFDAWQAPGLIVTYTANGNAGPDATMHHLEVIAGH